MILCNLCKEEIKTDDVKITRSRGNISKTYHVECHFELYNDGGSEIND